MPEATHQTLRTYHVTVVRDGDTHVHVRTRGHELYLGVRRGDPSVGFNAAETLLAALGACLMTNINTMAPKMRIPLQHVRIEIEGIRQDTPPAIVQISYRLYIGSSASEHALQKLHDMTAK